MIKLKGLLPETSHLRAMAGDMRFAVKELKDGDRFGNWTVVHFHPSYDSMRILRGGDFTVQNRVGQTGHNDGNLLKVEYDGSVWRTSYHNNTYEGTTPEELMNKLSEHDRL